MHEDILLGFSSTRFPASRPVKECRPAKENGFVEIILEKNEKKVVQLDSFKVVESGFKCLKDTTSRRKFCSELKEVLQKLKIAFCDDAQSDSSGELFSPSESILEISDIHDSIASTPTLDEVTKEPHPVETKKKKFHHRTLKEEIEIMRNAHPQQGKVSNRDFLETSNTKWRRTCEALLGFDPSKHDGTFGGSFREQIYLATLPECCYEELLHIFEAFKNGHIPTTRATSSIKPGLFAQLVGDKREVEVHHQLSNLASGIVSLEQFRKDLQASRINRNTEDSVTGLKNENSRLRQENKRLREEVARLKARKENDVDPYSELDVTPETQRNKSVDESVGKKKTDQGRTSSLRCKESELQQAWDILNTMVNNAEEAEETESETVEVSFNKGDEVDAFYSPEKRYYRAKILGKRKRPEGYRVKYVEDGFVEVIKKTYVRPLLI